MPQDWIEKLKTENIIYQPPENLLSSITESTKICKLVYQKFVLTKQINPIKAVTKWELIFDKEFETNKLFTQPFRLTHDTKLRTFQYKYIMQIIPNNSYLLQCGLTHSNLCDFCSMSVDSNMHMFWECPIIQQFWNSVKVYIEQTANLPSISNFDYEHISFCNVSVGHSKTSHIVNFIILLEKRYIFRNKYQNTIPNIYHFNTYLHNRLNIEEIIAFNKDQIETFRAIWNNFLTYFF